MTQAEAVPRASRGRSTFMMIGPGLLLAATGVGSGDLATGAIAGALLGTAVLWAAVAGAFLKFVVTEGLARWQLATGETLLEGVVHRLGPVALWLFLPYLLLWSFFVGSAQVSASGVTLHAIFPVFADARDGKIAFGVAAGLAGLAMVWLGGYRLFEIAMRICIGLMFVTVVTTAALLWPGTAEVVSGLLVPRIPDAGGEGLTWTIALMGGIGGTLTVLCYGYWLREEGFTGSRDLRACRLDLGIGYAMTAVFGVAMVVIGTTVRIEGGGAGLLVALSVELEDLLGPTGKWLFLVGSFGAVFSSLLGVWQAVPYLFADSWALLRRRPGEQAARASVDTRGRPYRIYLVLLALVPMLGLFFSFREVQKLYAVIGAWFFPALVLVLLVLNGRRAWIGERHRNRPLTSAVLLVVLAFFSWLGWRSIAGG